MNQTLLYTSAERAEDMLPSLSYAELVRNLGPLTVIGVISQSNPATMLVVARLIDRGRIQRSGISLAELRAALVEYRQGAGFIPVNSVIRALEIAISTLES
jgi:hypothetical protein